MTFFQGAVLVFLAVNTFLLAKILAELCHLSNIVPPLITGIKELIAREAKDIRNSLRP